jgi:glycosyltransferase involved in cell wall biosynthesis
LQRTTWLDITDIVAWRGNFTGIQRTTYEIARQFSDSGSARFCAFSPATGFRETTFPSREHFLEDAPTHPPICRIGHRRVLQFSARQVARAYRRLAPPTYRRWAGAKRTHLAEHIRLRRWARRGQNGLPSPFGQDDVLLVLGASWNETGRFPLIARLRNSLNLSLINAVYDLIPIKFPQFFGEDLSEIYLSYMTDAVSQSDCLLSISENTTKDIREFQKSMNLPEVAIARIRLGDSPVHIGTSSPPIPNLSPGSFVLAVGTVEIRKNYLTLYNAWVLAHETSVELPLLIIAGKPGWLAGDFLYQVQHDPRVHSKIILIETATDNELSWLYENCLFTVYPSWYEGWGLPIAESLNHGKFCIASNTSSMPEIAGDLLDYCSPGETQEFLHKISHYAHNPAALKAAEQKIATTYIPTSWTQTFDDTAMVISSVVSQTDAA